MVLPGTVTERQSEIIRELEKHLTQTTASFKSSPSNL